MQYGTQIGSLLTRSETQRLVVDLYNQGMPIKEIAAQVPVCLATVYRWINLPKHKNVKQKAEPKTEDSSAGGDSKKSVDGGATWTTVTLTLPADSTPHFP